MINWDLPLEAVGKNGIIISASIDKTFARPNQDQPVKLPRNVWVGDSNSGTWYFNKEGLATCGIGPDGYEGYFIIRNRSC